LTVSSNALIIIKTITNGSGSPKCTEQGESDAPITNHPPAKLLRWPLNKNKEVIKANINSMKGTSLFNESHYWCGQFSEKKNYGVPDPFAIPNSQSSKWRSANLFAWILNSIDKTAGFFHSFKAFQEEKEKASVQCFMVFQYLMMVVVVVIIMSIWVSSVPYNLKLWK
jgi:hypothetical protein